LVSASYGLLSCKKDPLNSDEEREVIDREIVVIGSGFGGSITCLRLTQSGHPVTLLERGKSWVTDGQSKVFSNGFGTDKESTWLSKIPSQPFLPPLPILNRKYTGVAEKIEFRNLTTVVASCLGGGTIINGGILLQPQEDIFNKVFGESLSYNELIPYYQKVKNEIGASVMPDSILDNKNYKHNKIFKSHNENSGFETIDITNDIDWNIIQEEIDGTKRKSAIIGESLFGINSGAKLSANKNYLLRAENTGKLEIKTLSVVTEIKEDENKNYLVMVDEIDTFGKVKNKIIYRCKNLFLCAGSVHTSRLLVKSKAKNLLTGLNDETGKGFGNNGNAMMLRENSGTDTGSVQAFPPRYGAIDYADSGNPIFVEHFPFNIGFEAGALGYNVIGLNPSRGYFEYNSATDEVDLVYPTGSANQQRNVNEKALAYLRKINADNGGKISSFLGKIPLDNMTYHPLGGMVMDKACDNFGRVKGKTRLYVLDSSIIPGSTACANPALTIAAIVERNIEKIIAEDL
jgi:cholesterol oxidase